MCGSYGWNLVELVLQRLQSLQTSSIAAVREYDPELQAVRISLAVQVEHIKSHIVRSQCNLLINGFRAYSVHWRIIS